MFSSPIIIKNLTVSFFHKVCFTNFSTTIHYGDRIALIGTNGSGKSTLLKIFIGELQSLSGSINLPSGITIGYVPQIINNLAAQSGGQRFNSALTQALAKQPDILILDEPTNHLDTYNRQSLLNMLKVYPGTLIIVSHDEHLLNTIPSIIWHLDQEKISIHNGRYDDYQTQRIMNKTAIEKKISSLNKQKQELHHAKMQEQSRAKKSKTHGKKMIAQRSMDIMTAGHLKNQAQKVSGKKQNKLNQEKQQLIEELTHHRLPEIIKPTFTIEANYSATKEIIAIRDGSIGYQEPLITHINFSVLGKERIAICGNNGSGKSTFLKALLSDHTVTRNGSWLVPQPTSIGYLDQHYTTLPDNQLVITFIQQIAGMNHPEARKHLNTFLFRKNEEINALIKTLSGGEKARLSLAAIAAKTPSIVILDEITNNLDRETRTHVIEVLIHYPGTLIVVSHDQNLLKQLCIETVYTIKNNELKLDI